jgi:hypothetical protein
MAYLIMEVSAPEEESSDSKLSLINVGINVILHPQGVKNHCAVERIKTITPLRTQRPQGNKWGKTFHRKEHKDYMERWS